MCVGVSRDKDFGAFYVRPRKEFGRQELGNREVSVGSIPYGMSNALAHFRHCFDP